MMEVLGLSSFGRHEWTLLGTGACTVLAVLLSAQLVSSHLRHWSNLKEQKAIVAIVLMAPLYAVVSLVGLIEIRGSTTFFSFLEAVKECYEALALKITCFCFGGTIYTDRFGRGPTSSPMP